MSTLLWVASVTVVAGAATVAATGPILRGLPEPAGGPDLVPGPEPAGDRFVAGPPTEDGATEEQRAALAHAAAVRAKPPYASLATRPRIAVIGVVTAAATLAFTSTQPPHTWGCWLVLATLGVLLAAIDQATTWLPAVLTRAGWLLTVLGAGFAVLLGGTGDDVVRALVGGLAAGALFGVVWWLSRGGIAFGDVRLAPLVGAAGAASSWSMLIFVLLVGTITAGGHGAVRSLRHRGSSFPYAPGLVLGALAAAPLGALVGLLPA